MELSLLDIANLLLRRAKYIIISILLFTLIFNLYSRYHIAPTYTASVQMYVETDSSTTGAAINDLAYAQRVVTTYITILRSNLFYKNVQEASEEDYSYAWLHAVTTVQTINDTEIFQISVTTNNPKTSYEIVKTMETVAPATIKSIKPLAQIGIVDPVTYPSGPSGPDIRKYSMFGALLGALLSCILICLWEVLNDKVKNQEELGNKYCIPVLGTIPAYGTRSLSDLLPLQSVPLLNRLPLLQKPIKVRKQNTNLLINEAFNTIRTNLRFTLRKDSCKKLLITSPMPNDGKSTVSANLAIALANSGARVLLMDCDLRKGELNRYFQLKKIPGVTDILTGMTGDKLAILNTNFNNLQFIPRGSLPPNPGELMGSVQMEELINRLDKMYDFIIIDTPPVNLMSDAFNLIKLVDGIVLVVKERATTYSDIRETVNKCKLSEANIAGFVVNAVRVNTSRKSNYYYYKKYKSHD